MRFKFPIEMPGHAIGPQHAARLAVCDNGGKRVQESSVAETDHDLSREHRRMIGMRVAVARLAERLHRGVRVRHRNEVDLNAEAAPQVDVVIQFGVGAAVEGRVSGDPDFARHGSDLTA